jgi:hypothetical protein
MEPIECACDPAEGCDEERCDYCRALDGEYDCPADPAAYDSMIEGLMDILKPEGFEPVVVDASGKEPFASHDLGGGLALDLTATLRRVTQFDGEPS